jgi:hypothetical protein
VQEICDLFPADYDFLVQIVEKLRIASKEQVLRRLKSASGHQTPCTVKCLLCVGFAATEETTAASAAELK